MGRTNAVAPDGTAYTLSWAWVWLGRRAGSRRARFARTAIVAGVLAVVGLAIGLVAAAFIARTFVDALGMAIAGATILPLAAARLGLPYLVPTHWVITASWERNGNRRRKQWSVDGRKEALRVNLDDLVGRITSGRPLDDS